jgi:hypothetical protein
MARSIDGTAGVVAVWLAPAAQERSKFAVNPSLNRGI